VVRINNVSLESMAIAAIVLSIVFCGCTKQHPTSRNEVPRRIISLAPSITETLFAMDLGSAVVGVTTYCQYPPEVSQIEKIGGYSNANVEKIIALKPDLVILQEDHKKQKTFLDRFGIQTLTVRYTSIRSMCSSYVAIGDLCGRGSQADSLCQSLSTLALEDGEQGLSPRVLLCVGRAAMPGGTLNSIFAAGASTFYADLVKAAGGTNAYEKPSPLYPQLSLEGLLVLQPDMIIDIAAAMVDYSCSSLIAQWQDLENLKAVQEQGIYCINASYATLPGPRSVLLYQDLKDIIDKWRQQHQ